MPRKKVGQLGLLDAAVSRRGGGEEDALGRLSRLIDWSRFDLVLKDVHASRKGEASYPPLVMFKVLLLQRWHGLSDPGLEAALRDRLSFLRFAGLSLEDPTPDHSTIWRFREMLGRKGLLEKLMSELNAQLEEHGAFVRQGTLIDASLVISAARRPRMREGKISPADPQAAFGTTNERGRYGFGYKLHVAVDAGSQLIRGLVVTPANVQEVSVAPQLLGCAAGIVYGDRGYDSDRLRAQLSRRGLGEGLMRRRRGRDLTAGEIEQNHALSLARRPVEAVFGTMKRIYRMGRMRAFTLARNTADLTLFCMAFNLRRLVRLTTP